MHSVPEAPPELPLLSSRDVHLFILQLREKELLFLVFITSTTIFEILPSSGQVWRRRSEVIQERSEVEKKVSMVKTEPSEQGISHVLTKTLSAILSTIVSLN